MGTLYSSCGIVLVLLLIVSCKKEEPKPVPGCMDSSYWNYDPSHNVEDNSCCREVALAVGHVYTDSVIVYPLIPDSINALWSEPVSINVSLSFNKSHTTTEGPCQNVEWAGEHCKNYLTAQVHFRQGLYGQEILELTNALHFSDVPSIEIHYEIALTNDESILTLDDLIVVSAETENSLVTVLERQVELGSDCEVFQIENSSIRILEVVYL